ncbi:hypothetical protein PR048_013082, partial [Dryococelus australis]
MADNELSSKNAAFRSERRMLHKDLRFHTQKIMVVEQLLPGDVQRWQFCEKMLAILNDGANAVVLMSEEAYFHVKAAVLIGDESRELHQLSLHSPKVTVCCAVVKFGITVPYFYEEENVSVTVTLASEIKILNTFLQPELDIRRVSMSDLWFQQDGATSHMSRRVMAFVRHIFPQHVIYRFDDFPYIKCTQAGRTPLRLLKECIRQQIAAVREEMAVSAMQDFEERLKLCMQEGGHHLAD